MSEEHEDEATELAVTAEPDPADVLRTGMVRLRRLVWLLGGFCVLSLAGVGVLAGMQLSGDASRQALQDRLEEQISNLERSRQELDQVVEENAGDISGNSDLLATVSRRLSEVDVTDSENMVFQMRRLLIRQERDFRDFLNSLEQGMFTMHRMIPHSRSWWDEYQGQLQDSRELSEARENYLFEMQAE